MKIYKVKVNGKVYEVELEAVSEEAGHISAPQTSTPSASNGSGVEVKSPMQGNILAINVQVGSVVKKGQVVAILEAMKLENEILAPVDGKVIEVVVTKGQTVNNQQTLLIIG